MSSLKGLMLKQWPLEKLQRTHPINTILMNSSVFNKSLKMEPTKNRTFLKAIKSKRKADSNDPGSFTDRELLNKWISEFEKALKMINRGLL